MAGYAVPSRYSLKVPGSGRRWGKLLWFGGLTALAAILFIGQNNLTRLLSLQQDVTRLVRQRDALQAANTRLERQVKDLKAHPQAVEPIAREELGLALPGERIYRFLPDTGARQDKETKR